MREKLYQYLSIRKEPASSEELVQSVLAVQGAKSVIADRIIEDAVAGDNRFVRDGSGNWYVTKKQGSLLSDIEFVLCQVNPKRTDNFMQIRSIACAKLKNNRVTAQNIWNILWNSNSKIIETSEKFYSPLKTFKKVYQFLDDAVLVMDGFGNQSSMLDSALRFEIGTNLESETFTLRRLSNRLYDDKPVSSVSELSAITGVSYFEDAEPNEQLQNIIEIFLALLESVEARGILTLEELLDFCYPDKLTVDYEKYDFDYNFIENLPCRPGVYIMCDKNGEIIYIGKAKNLSRRVGSYFLSREQRDEKTEKILETLYDLEIRVLGSELEALVEENRLICEFNPSINRQVEVHSKQEFEWQPQILFLPSEKEEAVEMFLLANRQLGQITAKKDLSNIDKVEYAVSDFFFSQEKQQNHPPSPAAQITTRWLEGHKDNVTILELKWIPDLNVCINRIKEYIFDFGLEKVVHM